MKFNVFVIVSEYVLNITRLIFILRKKQPKGLFTFATLRELDITNHNFTFRIIIFLRIFSSLRKIFSKRKRYLLTTRDYPRIEDFRNMRNVFIYHFRIDKI